MKGTPSSGGSPADAGVFVAPVSSPAVAFSRHAASPPSHEASMTPGTGADVPGDHGVPATSTAALALTYAVGDVDYNDE